MRTLLTLILLSTTALTWAQDLDFPDYRNKRDNFIKISDKDVRADQASFSLAGVDESIGKAQLNAVPIKDYGPNFMTFQNDNIQVTVKTGVFFPTKHKLMFSEKHLVKIDGKAYYGGNYGEQPHTTIDAVTVIVGKDTVPIPATAYFDLYDPKFSFTQSGSTRTRNAVYLSNDKHTFYIYMLNPDNGGTEYTFVIRDKQYLRRVVDYGFLK
ncbi:MAG TPA: hypothetical protein VNS58_29795 [Puia sp.]|nr:hypothetical protein [Puia sp.]